MTTQHILHISNDYTGSKVYKNLFSELDRQGLIQTIYTPIRSKSQIGLNSIEFQNVNSKIFYSPILNKHIDRLIYPYKIYKIYKNLEKKINLNDINYIHAHTWYSDGGVAFFLSKKYNIPFTVTVRNTDINFFYKRLRYLGSFGRKILAKSDNVIFICAPYKYRLMRDSKIKKLIQSKSKTIPNGVDDFWIKNSKLKENSAISRELNIIFVGALNNNKNIIPLVRAIIELNAEISENINLHIVSHGGVLKNKVLNLVKKNPGFLYFHGAINNKSELLAIYRKCQIFAMPSKHETFGLVYIEAMLQGLPILYTAKEGVDGLYHHKIGEKVKKHSINEIKKKLKLLIKNIEIYEVPLQEIKTNHSWKKVARVHAELYLNRTVE